MNEACVAGFVDYECLCIEGTYTDEASSMQRHRLLACVSSRFDWASRHGSNSTSLGASRKHLGGISTSPIWKQRHARLDFQAQVEKNP